MDNRVEYGLENVRVALLAPESVESGSPVWAAPIQLPGALRLSVTPQGDQTQVWADNKLFYEHEENYGYTGELNVSLVSMEHRAMLLGLVPDAAGAYGESTEDARPEFALLCEFGGDAKQRRQVYYRCKVSRMASEHTSKNRPMTLNAPVLPITMTPILIGDMQWTFNIVPKGSVNYDTFYDAVVAPAPPQVTKDALAALIATLVPLGLNDATHQADYTEASWNAFVAARANAAAVNGAPSPSQHQVDLAVRQLSAKLAGLVVNP